MKISRVLKFAGLIILFFSATNILLGLGGNEDSNSSSNPFIPSSNFSVKILDGKNLWISAENVSINKQTVLVGYLNEIKITISFTKLKNVKF